MLKMSSRSATKAHERKDRLIQFSKMSIDGDAIEKTKASQSSKSRRIKIVTVFERKRRREKGEKKRRSQSSAFEQDWKPLYHTNVTPSPISPRIYKFPSSMGISPRLGSISVPMRDRLPQLL